MESIFCPTATPQSVHNLNPRLWSPKCVLCGAWIREQGICGEYIFALCARKIRFSQVNYRVVCVVVRGSGWSRFHGHQCQWTHFLGKVQRLERYEVVVTSGGNCSIHRQRPRHMQSSINWPHIITTLQVPPVQTIRKVILIRVLVGALLHNQTFG